MAEGSEEQPVLLTEGEFVADDDDKPSENQDTIVNDSQKEPQQLESSEPAIVDAPETPAEKQEQIAEPPPPATAPEANEVEDSLKNVERSALSALSTSESNGNVVGGGGDDALEALSDKLEQVPSEAGDGDEAEYIAPPEDPYMRAVNYMEKHKVMQLFQKLTAEIVYHRPPDPLEHMLAELQKMKKERDANIDAIISSASSKRK